MYLYESRDALFTFASQVLVQLRARHCGSSLFKMKLTVVLFALLFLQVASASKCKPVMKVTTEFCKRPPVANVILPAYVSLWFQIYADKNALRVSSSRCTTAYYTPSFDGTIHVLNCFHPRARPRPLCTEGVASRRPDGGSDSRLQVQFSPQIPPGSYNIAAVLGSPQYGYFAAAVFSCSVVRGKPVTSWFMLARSPFRSWFTLRLLQQKLKCMGYPIFKEKLFRTEHGPSCTYLFSGKGFDVRPPSITMNNA